MKYKALVRDGHHAYVYDIWEYINLGDWWYKQWVITIGPELAFVVEADNESDALDELVDDGRWNHLIAADEDNENASFAGNNGIPIMLFGGDNDVLIIKAAYVWAVDEATKDFIGFICEPRDLQAYSAGRLGHEITTGEIKYEGAVEW